MLTKINQDQLTILARSAVEPLSGCLPHGLSQFDAEDCLVLANRRFRQMYDLPNEAVEPGVGLEEILDHIKCPDLRGLFARVAKQNELPGEESQAWRTKNDQRIVVSRESLPGDGYAMLHELVTESEAVPTRNERIADEDSLTGLLNRSAFQGELIHQIEAIQSAGELALLYLDLDRFKPINDTLGHPVGDLVLKEVAERVRAATRPDDSLARLGGDEFAILQVGSPQPGGSRALAKRIITSLEKPFYPDGHTINLGVSIGVAIAPFDAATPDELLKNADLALYRAKEDGRNLVRYFEPSMNERLQERRRLEIKLRQALDKEEFEVVYQPVKDFASDRIVSVEGLVRWHHPELGQVSPANFVPLAEETGLIVPLGEWVLQQACRDAAAWQGDIGVAVNVSPVQLKNRAFVKTVTDALKAAGLEPHRLELEITETALLADTELTIAILTELRAQGIKIAMDDFGTGYSSISYLRQFQFDKIKIDRSFVSGVKAGSEAASLVKMIASLGVTLAVSTTAEGVETLDELEMVRDAGCSHIQGYLLSKPVPLSQLPALFA